MAPLAYALTLLSACVDTSAPDNAGPSEESPDVAAASALAGVYDFTSSVTQFDPAYGDLTGAMQMFAMTIRSEAGTNRLVGTATNFQDIHLDLRITPWQTLPGSRSKLTRLVGASSLSTPSFRARSGPSS